MHSFDGQHTVQQEHSISGEFPPQSAQRSKLSVLSFKVQIPTGTDPLKPFFSIPKPAEVDEQQKRHT